MEPLLAALVVAAAALGARRWLAEFVERTALTALGPVAGVPEAAHAAAAALPLAPHLRGVPGLRAGAVPPAGESARDGVRGVLGLRAAAGAGVALSADGAGWGGLTVAAGSGSVGVAVAAVGGAVAWAGYGAWLPALVFTAGLGSVLAAVDVRSHRLPDALVLPAYPALAFLLCAGALASRTGLAPLVRAAEGGVVAFGVVYLLAVAVPAGFGFGDVKLTGLLGAVLAGYGWSAVVSALFTGFVYGGVCAAALLVTRRLARTDRLAFGPFLLAGALTAVLVR